ncbi:polyphosphate kinase 1 [Puteibacter caeruleilacunae]|nr:polyphosphate kinase 1 [Puteibacter caeruleilacunae]
MHTKYINREISWLSFNERVLQEAADQNVPLLERLRFLGIFSNNLDEFFRVRVATVRRMLLVGEDENILLGELTAEELHEKITETVIKQQKKFQGIYENILDELSDENIFMVNENQLTPEQGEIVRKYFHNKVLPNLVPIMLKQVNQFPMLRDRSVYLAVKLSKSEKPKEHTYSLVRIPGKSVPRFLVLPQDGNKKFVIILDDIIRYCLKELFPIFDYDVIEAYAFKITRDAELDIDDDVSKSFIEKMEASLKQRKKGSAVRMVHDREMPEDLLQFLLKKMKFGKRDNLIAGGRYHNRKDFMSFPEVGEEHHYYKGIPPLSHPQLKPERSVLAQMKEKDFVLHYPYNDFSDFINLLREAAIDPNVRQIGLTVYRVATFSKVMSALQNAARNGKQVTVLLELQARFDEENNIYWSNKLQEEGVNVIHGVPGLKVHSKLAYIAREEDGKLKSYAYVGTGNFHEGTARVYADEGLFTADPRIAEEVSKVFDFFRLNYKHHKYEHLVVSPFVLRDHFSMLIDNEIRLAKAGEEAYIILKLNSLVDKNMVNKLYEASSAGVKIQLIIRGICSLIPGIPGVSENIQAISIVDKFLEHSRILLFGNGGDEKIYIASADWMPRNLNRRIEIACPIYDEQVKEELRKQLDIQLMDNQKARYLDRDLTNRYVNTSTEKKCRSQEDYYCYLKNRYNGKEND